MLSHFGSHQTEQKMKMSTYTEWKYQIGKSLLQINSLIVMTTH